ncbi:DEAD/DEAH box RNA helicase, putative [Phytophthora infestans T30-4]|uniref:RNA helicase n=1 Tax=Phytophthora infestans (strain T30-4) TaxID=403677 RepID=D0NN87_PHYIT|nr:DEAD/DEAH box RNA helicase, putative [Phytophthora infestans T30-4]EEY61994.1 DEAD/DEAH box RNA helicase, putative [Phytophthora infestans T30-4]|eukprot:XP_002899634.1 DEAD/DEAH box RNA helicase, putative [Phytophthora infestans T30-4]
MAKKVMEVLTPIDHSTVTYEPFRKSFYSAHSETCALKAQEVANLRSELDVRVDGVDVPAPVRSFMHLGLDRKMLQTLMKLGLEAPTAIQTQAFPVALSGRDLIGIAKTGSGKTLAFTLPMVRHVMDQRELQRGEGPIALVLAPTRELAHQTYVQAKKFLAVYGASCAAIYGGAGKWEQVQALKKGVEVVVATPGRLIEMIRKKAAPMNRVTFVVLDEADRMFEMGFEPQLRSVMGQVRPDRQILMFSATFRRRIETLALDVLTNPVKLTVGQIGQANEDIRQIAVVLPGHGAKWPWLMSKIRSLVDEGRLLIFAGSKAGCEELAKNLAVAFPAAPALCLHGDKTQQERAEALTKFKHGACRVLVATDVAARGLDVKDVKNVVNFDVAKSIDTHVHRIGRTGRMGLEGFEPGTAYTLVTRNESQFAAQLVYNMDVSGQSVSAELLALARKDSRFQQS